MLQDEYIKQLEQDGQNLKKAEAKINRLNENIASQEVEIRALQENAARFDEVLSEKNEKLRAQEREHLVKIQELETAHGDQLKEKETDCKERISAAQKIADEANAKYKQMDEERCLVQAQLHGLRQQYHLIPENEDYTSKEQFKELEREFNAFEDFLKKQWKYTKKRIRKDILWSKPEKK